MIVLFSFVYILGLWLATMLVNWDYNMPIAVGCMALVIALMLPPNRDLRAIGTMIFTQAAFNLMLSSLLISKYARTQFVFVCMVLLSLTAVSGVAWLVADSHTKNGPQEPYTPNRTVDKFILLGAQGVTAILMLASGHPHLSWLVTGLIAVLAYLYRYRQPSEPEYVAD